MDGSLKLANRFFKKERKREREREIEREREREREREIEREGERAHTACMALSTYGGLLLAFSRLQKM